MSTQIREATKADFESIWPIFHDIVFAGETYPYDPDTNKKEACRLWMEVPQFIYVVEEAGEILGTYYIKANQPALGAHVCNCGYMVSNNSRGKGIGTLMCQHSQKIAVEKNFKAMQFNLVVSTNEKAVRLWGNLGFKKLATLPKAFNHKSLGLVDAFIFYKWLNQ